MTYGAYDYGLGDMDVVAIRLGEFGDEDGILTRQEALRAKRNKIREYLAAPALVDKNDYCTEDEHVYITEAMRDCPEVQAMEEAVFDIVEK
ncbi:MAG: hypothetical protein M1835_003950, partial [Candelina submexicana]